MNLDGTWKVKVTSGPRWFRLLNLIRNKKIISGDIGHNIGAGAVRWGHFKIVDRHKYTYNFEYKDLPIVDIVWAVSTDLLFGNFYWKKKLIGNFKMERMK